MLLSLENTKIPLNLHYFGLSTMKQSFTTGWAINLVFDDLPRSQRLTCQRRRTISD